MPSRADLYFKINTPSSTYVPPTPARTPRFRIEFLSQRNRKASWQVSETLFDPVTTAEARRRLQNYTTSPLHHYRSCEFRLVRCHDEKVIATTQHAKLKSK